MNRSFPSEDYKRLEQLVDIVTHHFAVHPSLEWVANQLHIRPSELNKLLNDWCGKSFAEIMPFLHPDYAKHCLKGRKEHTMIFEQSSKSKPKIPHSLTMTELSINHSHPSQTALEVSYHFYPSPFGEVLIANTQRGVCYMGFWDDRNIARANLHNYLPTAVFLHQKHEFHESALSFFDMPTDELVSLTLDVKGTDFQRKVWQSLLDIHIGGLVTYSDVCETLGYSSQSSRAVGTAIGHNPIAFLIPCHRVVASSGVMSGYMWGIGRKKAIIAWEAAMFS